MILADPLMNLDNVIAAATPARDNVFLLPFGWGVNMPLIVWSSPIIMKDRRPTGCSVS